MTKKKPQRAYPALTKRTKERVERVLDQLISPHELSKDNKLIPLRVIPTSSGGVAVRFKGSAWLMYDTHLGSSIRGYIAEKYNNNVFNALEAAEDLGLITGAEHGAFAEWLHDVRRVHEHERRVAAMHSEAALLGYTVRKS